MRAECIDQHLFLSLDDARSKCEAFRREYNEDRPQSSIGNKNPLEFMKSAGHPSRSGARSKQVIKSVHVDQQSGGVVVSPDREIWEKT